MTLDEKVMEGVEQELKEQSDLVSLANAWMDWSGGKVVEGVTINRDEYIELLQSIPLWDEVKGNCSLVENLMKDFSNPFILRFLFLPPKECGNIKVIHILDRLCNFCFSGNSLLTKYGRLL